jgi:hypothetical protein
VKYYWTECPGCHCEVAVNTVAAAGKVTGSLRRWSRDRSINDGRAIRGTPLDAEGGFATECVCGRLLTFGAVASAVGSQRDSS